MDWTLRIVFTSTIVLTAIPIFCCLFIICVQKEI